MKESLRLFVMVLLIALAFLLVFPAESWAEYVSRERNKKVTLNLLDDFSVYINEERRQYD